MILLDVVMNSQLMAEEKTSKEVKKQQVLGFGFSKPHTAVKIVVHKWPYLAD